MSISSVRNQEMTPCELNSNKSFDLIKHISTLKSVEKLALCTFAAVAIFSIFYFSSSCIGFNFSIGAPVVCLSVLLIAALFFGK